jgi:hypothetical protein
MSAGKYTDKTFQEAKVIDNAPVGSLYYWNAHCLGKTNQDIYINCMIQYVRNCTAANEVSNIGNPTSCIPWIEPPREKVGGSEGITVHDASYADILTVLKGQYNLGVRRWLVFNPSFAQDYFVNNGITNDNSKSRVDEFTKLVNEFVAWTKQQTVTQFATATATTSAPSKTTTKTKINLRHNK